VRGALSFPKTCEAIEAGIRDGLHPGAQLYISLEGQPIADLAFGECRPGAPMTTDTRALWFSAGKPLTAIAIAQLVEHGDLKWDSPVAEVIPPFAEHGKEQITVRHLLTHTAGLHAADDLPPLAWPEKIGAICASPLPNGWIVGERAAYSSGAAWFILGELIQRLTSRPLAEVVQQNICSPAGLRRTTLAVSGAELEETRNEIGFMYDTTQGLKALDFWNSDEGLQRCIPGGSARGPVRELGQIYEALLAGGPPLLYSDTVRAMTQRQRVGIFDETFRYTLDCGLCFILNSNRDGMQMPYGYGRAASPETFGHSGNRSSCAFADPERRLAVAWACNGMPDERRHQQRQRAINNAIFEDLESF
jgi:CubicO group peptidase (beta-lactamase class C family)